MKFGMRQVTDETVEEGYRKCIQGASGNVQLIHALELERVGGPCPLCREALGAVDVDNRYGKFTYYAPSCACFKQCTYCKRWLIAERLLEINYCTQCKPHTYGGETTRKIRKTAKQREEGLEHE